MLFEMVLIINKRSGWGIVLNIWFTDLSNVQKREKSSMVT